MHRAGTGAAQRLLSRKVSRKEQHMLFVLMYQRACRARAAGCVGKCSSATVSTAPHRAGWYAAYAAASGSSSNVSPAQAAAMMEESDAAFQRCKGVLPPAWVAKLRSVRDTAAIQRPVIQAHLPRSPGSWKRGILEAEREALRTRAKRVLRKADEGVPPCDGCGQQAVSLRSCSACKQRRYVSEGGQRCCCLVRTSAACT